MEAVASGRQPKKEGSEGQGGAGANPPGFLHAAILLFFLSNVDILKKCGRSVTLPSGRRHASGRRKRSYATGYPDEIS